MNHLRTFRLSALVTICAAIAFVGLLAALRPAYAAASVLHQAATARAQADVSQTLILTPTQNAEIDARFPKTPFVDSGALSVGRSYLRAEGLPKHILLDFDLSAIPSDAVIDRAALRMTQFNWSGSDNAWALSVAANSNAWQAQTVTWDARPDTTCCFATVDTFANSAPMPVTWNMTGLVQAWVDGTLDNHGLAVQGDPSMPDDIARFFGSRTNQSGSVPQLLIAYSLPPARVQLCRESNGECVPVPGATVYRAADGAAFATDENGIAMTGVVTPGDELWATTSVPYTPTYPIGATDSFTLYHTSGATATLVTANDFEADNFYRIYVSEESPLLVQDVSVSAQWVLTEALNGGGTDANLFATRVVSAANYLYGFTQGQVTLGRVTVSQEEDNWQCDNTDLCLHMDNNLRPKAIIGGVVSTDTVDPLTGNEYNPGLISMGRAWNRYYQPPGTTVTVTTPGEGSAPLAVDSLTEDWPMALAHEFGHYLFFLYDTYLDSSNTISPTLIASCVGSAMNDVYAPINHGFIGDQALWDGACSGSLAHGKHGPRTEWATMRTFHPWMIAPPASAVNAPPMLPVSLTRVDFLPPSAPLAPLQANQVYDLGYRDGENASAQARGYLFRSDRLFAQGQPVPGSTEIALTNARIGDRLCLYDINDNAEGALAGDGTPRHQFGCETVAVGDNLLDLTKNEAWAPVVTVSQNSTTSVQISVTQPLAVGDAPLVARFYAEQAGAVGAPVVINDAVVSASQHSATFDFGGPLPPFFVQLYIDEEITNVRPEVVFERGTGGGGAFGPFRDFGGVLVYSADGLATFISSADRDLKTGQSVAWQTMPGTPPLPPGASIVGQSYRLDAFPADLTALGVVDIRFSEPGGGSVQTAGTAQTANNLALHRWNGSAWQAIDTTVKIPANAEIGTQVASASSQGAGVYALLRLPTESSPRQIFVPIVAR